MSFCLLGTHRFTGCDVQNLTVEHILLQPAPLNLAPYRNRELILNVIHTENKVSSSLMNSLAAKSWSTCQHWYTLWLPDPPHEHNMCPLWNVLKTWWKLHMILFALFSLLDNIHICKDFTFKSDDYVQICHPCVFKVTWFSFCCLVSWFLASTGQPQGDFYGSTHTLLHFTLFYAIFTLQQQQC